MICPTLLEWLSYYDRFRSIVAARLPDAKAMKRHRLAFYAGAWRDAANQTNSDILPLGNDIFEITNGGKRLWVCRQLSPFDDSVTLEVVGNKAIVYRLLERIDVPIPRHVAFTLREMATAESFLRSARKPVVVKPSFATGAGAGITTNISSVGQLRRAAARAGAHCPELLIEEQIEGDNFRLLYLDGRLLDVVQRKPPTVPGDGSSSLKELVRKENKLRLTEGAKRAQVLLQVDLDMRNTLSAQGMTLRSVPADGQDVAVKRVINDNGAGENEAADHKICEAIVVMGTRIVNQIGAKLAGIDIITENPSLDLAASGGAVIEVNTTPGYYYHQNRLGEPFPVPLHILRRFLGVTDEA